MLGKNKLFFCSGNVNENCQNAWFFWCFAIDARRNLRLDAFPHRLPISEFKAFNKAVWLSDLPYAYETIGTYDKVVFFDPLSPARLAYKIEKYILQGESSAGSTLDVTASPPMASNWDELFEIILSKTL